jgi:hydroxyacylglutathione hydrolase
MGGTGAAPLKQSAYQVAVSHSNGSSFTARLREKRGADFFRRALDRSPSSCASPRLPEKITMGLNDAERNVTATPLFAETSLGIPEPKIEAIESMPFAENSYILHGAAGGECIVFDPGLEPELILDRLREERLVPAAILLTHGHCDHIAGIPALKQAWPNCPVVIGRNDAEMLTNPAKNLSAQYGLPYACEAADLLLDDGQTYSAAGFEFEAREISGHSKGHVVFLLKGVTPPVVFGGDVLFRGSIGRSDFPGGSFNDLALGIRKKLYMLPDDTIVYPGHGPATTIGEEKRSNPFVRAEG